MANADKRSESGRPRHRLYQEAPARDPGQRPDYNTSGTGDYMPGHHAQYGEEVDRYHQGSNENYGMRREYAGTPARGGSGFHYVSSDNFSPSEAHVHREGTVRFDPDYHRLRSEQIRNFDQDFDVWRRERRTEFSTEFDEWRATRPQRGQTRVLESNGVPDDAEGKNQK
ncbi:MAG: hypothetical protein JO002_09185 [Burkholderiaceae bacterium]|nr:hypothetical protein [Burkholderiaceae bacterium]